MGLFSKLNELERGFSWSLLGFVVAIIFGSVTIYVEFIKENKPDLNFIITGNSSVLDIRENLGNLDVLYQGDSLSKKNKDLRIISFKVINQGDTSILSNFYDENDPVGFNVINGVIADTPKLNDASNEYLKSQLVISKVNESKIIFSNVIIEEGEFFEIKILVLHDVSSLPEVSPLGKVAGVNSIDILTDYDKGLEKSFLEESFSGDVYVSLARFVVFGLAFLFCFIGVIFISIEYDERKEKKKKKKLIKIFKDYESDKITEKDGFFFDFYITKGTEGISKLNDILSNHEFALKISNMNTDDIGRRSWLTESLYRGFYETLVSEGFIKRNGNNIEIDATRAQVLSNFVSYLKRKGEFKSELYSRVRNEEMTEIVRDKNA